MINAWTSRGRVLASYRSKSGDLSVRDLGEAEYAAFVRDPKVLRDEPAIIERREDFPGWTKLLFFDYEARRRALEDNPSILFEADVSPARRFLTDNYCKIDPPRRGFLDIETDSRVPFSKAILGETTLLSWAIVDADGTKRTAVLQDFHEQAEAELWAELWRMMAAYDQIAAWNGERFDFEVLKQRCNALARRYRGLFDPYWENHRRLLFVDQMLAFKRHHMAAESGDEKTSLRLDVVCEAIIGEGKNDFDSGKTWEAWAAGGAERQRLVDYNLQDTVLLPKLEAETGYLELQQTIAAVTLTPVNTHTLKPMPWIDAYLLKMARNRKTHLKSKVHGEGGHEEVEGAVVMAPTKLGIHENVHVCDFKSLYPTIIRSFNLGSETKLTKEEATRLAENTALFDENGVAPLCKAATGVYFRTDEESMLAAFCREMMAGRDKYKKEMKLHPPGTPEWKAVERMSKAFKIANNSGFGVTGNPFFRLYDPQITEAIIQGARLMLTTTSDVAKDKGKETIYGDTDSLFVIGGSVEDFDAFVRYCNAEIYPKVLDELGCRPDFRCVELAYEKQFARLIFPLGTKGSPSAKRYAGLYSHYGGKAATADSKPEIRGLEWMRTDTTKLARHMQREAIEMILRGQLGGEEVEEWVKSRRTRFFDNAVELEDIVLSKGISMALDAYKASPPHVRIARALAEEGEDVGEGTRISYVIEDGSVSPMAVIPAIDFDGTNLDKHHYWNKAIYPATLRVLAGAYPGRPWNRWIAKRPRRALAGQLQLGLT